MLFASCISLYFYSNPLHLRTPRTMNTTRVYLQPNPGKPDTSETRVQFTFLVHVRFHIGQKVQTGKMVNSGLSVQWQYEDWHTAALFLPPSERVGG